MRDEEEDDEENVLDQSQEVLMPAQRLPKGTLWTRIIDLDDLAGSNALAYSFEEDTANFRYEVQSSSS